MRLVSVVIYCAIVFACGGLGQHFIGWNVLSGWAPFLCACGGISICVLIEWARGWPGDSLDTW